MLFCLLLALGTGASGEHGLVEFDVSETKIFSASFECSPTYQTAQKIECRFDLKNNGQQDYSVLKWRTPLEGMISDCLTVTHNGKKLKYDGILVKRSIPGPDQFLLVAAGQTVSSTIAVYAGYDISESGSYSIALDTYLEYVEGSVKDMNVPGKSDIHKKLSQLSSPAVIFQVAEKNPARKTLGQSARYLEGENRYPGNRFFRLLWEKRGFVEQKIKAIEGRSVLLDPVVKRGTRGQKKATKEVHLAAYNHIKAAISDLKNNEERGKTWFGEGHVDYAITVFEKMEEILKMDKITYRFGGKYCDDEKFAYTFLNTRKIYLCNNYKKSRKLSGFDNKMGILTHELSHALAETNDKVYGISASKRLAKSGSRRAARNADNYEYFVETLSF